MSIEFRCQSCDKLLRTPDDSGGKKSKCPHCGEVMAIPQAGSQSAPAAVPPPSKMPGTVAQNGPTQKIAFGDLPTGSPATPNPFAEEPSNPYSSPMTTGGDPNTWGGTPHRGGMVLTLGLLGLIFSLPNCFCYCLLFMVFPGLGLSIPAWIMGSNDLKEMEQGQMDPSGQGMTRAGYIMGIIGVALCAVAVVCWIVLFAVGMVAGAVDGQNF